MRPCRGAEALLETPGAFDSRADWAQIKGDEICADLRHPRESARARGGAGHMADSGRRTRRITWATWWATRPGPNETVLCCGERGIAGVAGNYDSTVATDYKHCGCRYEDPRQEELSHVSYDWTRRHVSPATKRFSADCRSVSTCGPTAGTSPGRRSSWCTARRR